MNKFIGIGRNTKDGELRTSESNINIYNNSLAMTNNFKNKDGNYDSEFINYVAYRQIADYLNKYSKKGSLISIEGRLHTRSYDDKDKVKRYVTEVIVENANVLERKKEETQTAQEEPQATQIDIEVPQNIKSEYQDKEIVLQDSDLPF